MNLLFVDSGNEVLYARGDEFDEVFDNDDGEHSCVN